MSAKSSNKSSATARRYAVREGDSFSTFAGRYGVSEGRIATLNPGVDSSKLAIGRTLRVK